MNKLLLALIGLSIAAPVAWAGTPFANGLEVASKSANSSSISAFPDVAFTPPRRPATPPGVPIPYPNFGVDKDVSKGAPKQPLPKAPVLPKPPVKQPAPPLYQGKSFYQPFTFDVKVEGPSHVRHLDLHTHNHQ